MARSSAKAEFQGMANGVCELLCFKSVLKDLRIYIFIAIIRQPLRLYITMQHDHIKYVEVDRHFIKRISIKRLYNDPFVESESQLADILTKVISGKGFPWQLIS